MFVSLPTTQEQSCEIELVMSGLVKPGLGGKQWGMIDSIFPSYEKAHMHSGYLSLRAWFSGLKSGVLWL